MKEFSSHSDFKYNTIINQKIEQFSHSIAINQNNSLLLVSNSTKIEMFVILEEKLKKIQQIICHKRKVVSLNFFRTNRLFITGSFDSYIILWSTIMMSKPKYIQKLLGHNSTIQCIIKRLPNEDLIISCSTDYTIKFWIQLPKNNQQWICSQTVSVHQNIVWGISINQQGNQVISSGEDHLILVIEQNQQTQNWFIKQMIQVDQSGFSLCYINKNAFIFQPESSENLIVYTLNENQEFMKFKNFKVFGQGYCCYPYFPSIYNNQKQLLINKNGNYLNIMKVQEENQDTKYNYTEAEYSLKIIQVINYENYYIFGTLSDDGQYLITWDKISREIQFRKYQEIA
ncbi:unnamed protein product [Paramecium pentaurelia]|uniref:WD40-repeat-containing domain n=1 Tax=Paramecium pentaurelia TaxID=43138 RepID=A0A8S1VUD6_9CILI|nr:unnamed protein product [Paramecium pentaurelia]